MDGVRALGIPIPMYDTEERPTDLLLKPKQPSVTGYRILVSASAVSFGMTKAFLSYRGLDTAPTTVEWVYGVMITVRYDDPLFCLNRLRLTARRRTVCTGWACTKRARVKSCLGSSSPTIPSKVRRMDKRNAHTPNQISITVYSSIFAFGFIAVHLGALYAAHWWTRIWYLGVKDMISGDWTSDPNIPTFDKFFNNTFMLLWLVMAILMGIGSGVVGTCVVLGSLCRLLVPWIFQLVRACWRVVRRRSGQVNEEWGDDEATLVDFGGFPRMRRWLRNITWPSIQFSPATNEVWKKIGTACEQSRRRKPETVLTSLSAHSTLHRHCSGVHPRPRCRFHRHVRLDMPLVLRP